ncbi:hypothetical protein ES705_49513 [subsurface metagenome]
MKKHILFSYILIFLVMAGCIEEKDTETEQPKIELISPMPCDTLYYGESFLYKVKITDNTGMGNKAWIFTTISGITAMAHMKHVTWMHPKKL